MSTQPSLQSLVTSAAAALKDRVEEVNRLNVFPVPDGDTGTNMSLTMDAVLAALGELGPDPTLHDSCSAITHGSLMGARGNSGVILSQILRGLCEVIGDATVVDPKTVTDAMARSAEVAFQAVRKPVEGTMLTVLKDAANAARRSTRDGGSLEDVLDAIIAEAFESVRRTPDLLLVLKENNVVDAGGYGLAILAEGLVAAYRGKEVVLPQVELAAAPSFSVTPEDDWDDDEYLYCTEFLLFGEGIDRSVVEEFVAGAGGSELVVGDETTLKVHVHTDDPGAVLTYMTSVGELGEVHVNNMRRQTAERSAGLAADGRPSKPAKPIGIVTVAVGEGIRQILGSLGADTIVNGGQTMNPSTAELLEAIGRANAEAVLILPNNKNIILAAEQAAKNASIPVGVVPTRSVPQAFAAMLAFDPSADVEENVRAMTESITHVRTGEVTIAIKDSTSEVGPIATGDVIGIAEGAIRVTGSDVLDVALRLVEEILQDGDTVTLLAGEDLSDGELQELASCIEAAHPDIELETHRGSQPLYHLIVSAE